MVGVDGQVAGQVGVAGLTPHQCRQDSRSTDGQRSKRARPEFKDVIPCILQFDRHR